MHMYMHMQCDLMQDLDWSFLKILISGVIIQT